MAELSRDDVLPCDVLVAPGTIIRAGCNVSTLLLCLGNRVGREIAKLGPRGEIQAPQAVSVPGFVLVPKVATPEMMADGRTALRAGEMHINDAVHSVYKAMLSAAPAAATREGKE